MPNIYTASISWRENGPEFISLALAEWAENHAVKRAFIQSGKPMQNTLTEHTVQKYSIFICSEC
ncbi:transposase insK for insertion sequence element IS150 [Salmonella enterica subsp. enterica serovar Miami str. 1923]|nr:transposase insK for insertion sequence element IS150 [Salmonella enterica subsp. enterica serovar Miami str. 1923]